MEAATNLIHFQIWERTKIENISTNSSKLMAEEWEIRSHREYTQHDWPQWEKTSPAFGGFGYELWSVDICCKAAELTQRWSDFMEGFLSYKPGIDQVKVKSWLVGEKNDFNLCCLLSPHYIEWFILCLNTVLMAKPINFVFNCSKIFIIALFFNTTKHHDALVHYSVTRPCCLDKLESWKLGSGRWDLDGWSCLGTTLNLVIEYSNVELIIKWT